MLLYWQAGQVLLDSQGLAGRSGASIPAGASGAPRHSAVSRQVRGIGQQAGQGLLDRQGLAGGSGVSRPAGGLGGSGAPRLSGVSRQVRCF